MKIASLVAPEIKIGAKPKIDVLFETDFTKEIRIAFAKDQLMKEHKTSYPIVVEIFQGEIVFGVQEEKYILREGDLIALESNIPHDLKATKDSVVRLTLTKFDTVERVQSVNN